MSAIDGETGSDSTAAVTRATSSPTDRYVHPDIEDADALTALRAPTDAAAPLTGAPSTWPPDEPPAADEERTVSTIDIEGIPTTSCRGRPNRC